MTECVGLATSELLRVLIATQSASTGNALASLLGDPCDINYQIVDLSGVLPLGLLCEQLHSVDVLLLDLEPWPSSRLLTALATLQRPWPLVLALAHSVDDSMRRQCWDAGVDHLLDRTADLGHLQGVITSYVDARRAKKLQMLKTL